MSDLTEIRLIGLMRHGEAKHKAAIDADRKLSKHGWAQAHDTAEQFRSWVDSQHIPHGSFLICHSPYRRARETAQPLIEALAACSTQVLDYVLPDNEPSVVLKQLQLLSEKNPDKHLIVVAHMPLLASLCALLETGSYYNATALHTGELRLLQAGHVEAGCGTRIKTILPIG